MKTLRKGNYTISTDINKVDLQKLHRFLSQAYWSKGVPFHIMKKSIENSVPFSVLNEKDEFIGFARVISDLATFG
ncbi:MAG: GNAT family N-acetyltransferase, partial [Candidatus Kariarchaeaceae archaeon]